GLHRQTVSWHFTRPYAAGSTAVARSSGLRHGWPSPREAGVDRLVSPHGGRRRGLEGLLDRLAVALVKRFAQLGELSIVLLLLRLLGEGFGRRVVQPIGLVFLIQGFLERPQIDGVQPGKVIDPIELATAKAAEDHAVDRREVRTLRHADGPQVEIQIIVMDRAGLTIEDLRQEAAAGPERAEVEHPAIRPDHLVAVGEHIPEALADQLADLLLDRDGTLPELAGDLVPGGFGRHRAPVVRASQLTQVAMQPERLLVSLFPRRVEDG